MNVLKTTNARNGRKVKTIHSKYGKKLILKFHRIEKELFEPQIVKKRQKDISAIEDKIIFMYAKGMTTRQISEQIEDIYGFEVSEGLVSYITDKLLPKIEEWQQRPLFNIYPVVFVDAIHFSVRDNGIIKKKSCLYNSWYQ